jgi:hypothetical protein
MDRPELTENDQSDNEASAEGKAPYEPPRVLTDEAFEQISLACTMKFGVKKNFT